MATDGKEKNRKVETLSANVPPKKHKKSKKGDNVGVTKPTKSSDLQTSASQPPKIGNGHSESSQGARKRAIDFLSDDEESSIGGVKLPSESSEQSPKKDEEIGKKSKKQKMAKEQGTPKLVTEKVETLEERDNGSKVGKTVKKTVHFPKERDESQRVASTKTAKQPPSEQKKRGPTVSDQMVDRFNKLITTHPTQWKADRKNKQKQQPNEGQNKINKPHGAVQGSSFTSEAKDAASTALQTEAQGLSSEREEITEDDGNDHAPELLAGFDSDNPDDKEDEGLDPEAQSFTMPNYKRTNKKLRKAAEKGNNEGPGTIYVGRIPHGFYEHQMRAYFSQFGTITKLRLSRNRKTGASKHFAFVQFESKEVAKIVAETMDNYLMFGHILKCKFAPEETLHKDVWKGANRRYRPVPYNKIEKRALETPKTKEQWAKKIEREQKKREAKAEKLKEIGYNVELPKMTSVDEVLQGKTESLAESASATIPTADEAATTTAAQNEIAARSAETTKNETMPDDGDGEKPVSREAAAQEAATVVNDLPTSQRKVTKQRRRENKKKAIERKRNKTANNDGGAADDTFNGFPPSPAKPSAPPQEALTKEERKRRKKAEKKKQEKAATAAEAV